LLADGSMPGSVDIGAFLATQVRARPETAWDLWQSVITSSVGQRPNPTNLKTLQPNGFQRLAFGGV